MLGVSGIVLISLPVFHNGGTGELRGAFLALGFSSVVAVANIVVKRVIPKEDLLPAAAWQLLMGSVPLFIASWFIESWAKFHLDPKFVVLLLFLGIIGSGFNTFAWYRLLKREEVSMISMFYFVIPVIGMLAASLILGEVVEIEQWVGMAVTAGALVFLARESQTKASPVAGA